MTDDGEHNGPRDLLNRLTHKRPPWQVMVTGNADTGISADTVAALARILDLMPGVGHLTLQTAGGGGLNVTRDFRSAYLDEVDRKIAAIFAADPQITGIGFPKHTATPNDPHWSPTGKASAALAAARKAGDITPDEAIQRLKALHSGEPDHGAKDD